MHLFCTLYAGFSAQRVYLPLFVCIKIFLITEPI